MTWVSVEPVDRPNRLPEVLERERRGASHLRWNVAKSGQAFDEIKNSLGDKIPLTPAPVRELPESPPPVISKKLMAEGSRLVYYAVASPQRRRQLPHWYQLPNPPTSPARRGRNSRSPRELAEFAKLYVAYAEKYPEAPIKAITADFESTGANSQFWANLISTVSDNGYLIGRKAGVAGGQLSPHALSVIDVHIPWTSEDE